MQASTIGESGADGVALSVIEARLDRIERLLVPIAAAAERAPAGVATAVDILDDWVARDGNVDARVQALHRLLSQLTEPDTLDMLSAMIAHAHSLPGLVATVVDALDHAAEESARHGVEVEDLVYTLGRVVRGVSRLATAPELKAALESGMLAPQAMQTLGQLASSLGQARARSRPMGTLGVLRAVGDRGVRRALGFLMAVAADFGRGLAQDEQPKRLGGGHA